MAVLRSQISAITLATKNSATVGAAYTAVNADGLPQSCSIIRLVNDSDKAITVSYDGVSDNDYVIAGDTLQLELQTNAQPDTKRALMVRGTVVYVKGTAGTGTIALTGYYQKVI